MVSPRNDYFLPPALCLIAVVALFVHCSAQVARAEDCITCRTPRCSRKVGIEAWCGPGSDPLKKTIRHASARTVSKPTAVLPAEKRSEKSTESSAPLDINKREGDTGVGATVAPPPFDSTPPDTAAAAASDPSDATASLSTRELSVVPSQALPALASTAQNLARSENHALQPSKNKWTVVGLAAGGGLAISVTVFAIVLGKLPPRCGPPAGTVSLNRCPD